MISLTLALLALIVGYLLYGKVVERVFGPDDRPTPAVSMADGVDYIQLPSWKVFMIQFLNIAGTGPIFGAIMGAWYGPVAYLWIVLGCIFAGAVHDYLCGMLSMRHGGANMPQLVGDYLGATARRVMLVFSVFLLLMVGVVFVYSPALLLKDFGWTTMGWVVVILIYYILATMLPIDKIIGRFYPIFAFALLFMAFSLLVYLYVTMPELPELWTGLDNANSNVPAAMLGTSSYMAANPLFPCLFLTIACGAISGFHATQSPLMARCLKNEKAGRPIFYGAMICEGIVALIWATVSIYFFYYGGWKECVDAETVNQFTNQYQGGAGKTLIQFFTAPTVVEKVCTGWLGLFGGLLAVFGVVAAPITSGDTALRSARLMIAEALHLEQKSVVKRLYIAVPMFLAVIALLVWQETNSDGFNTIWQWFGWSNQTLAVFTLWMMVVYMVRTHKAYFMVLVPALFMTLVCATFLLVSPMALGLNPTVAYVGTVIVFLIAAIWFCVWKARDGKKANN